VILIGIHVHTTGGYAPGNDTGLNPRGYFEGLDVQAVDDGVLKATGAKWHTPCNVNTTEYAYGCLPRGQSTEHIIRLRTLDLVSRLNHYAIWLIKDPRLCLTMAWWRQAFTRPVCLIMYRNPRSVGASMAKWNTKERFTSQRGMALWEIYNIYALNQCIDVPTILVSHYDVVSQPHATVAAIVKHLQELAIGARTSLQMSSDEATPSSVQHFIRVPHQHEIDSRYEPKLVHFTSISSVHHEASSLTNGIGDGRHPNEVPFALFEYLNHLHTNDGDKRTILYWRQYADVFTMRMCRRSIGAVLPRDATTSPNTIDKPIVGVMSQSACRSRIKKGVSTWPFRNTSDISNPRRFRPPQGGPPP
jgi:hypothetical protein